jgi:hypothetical protein
MADYCKLHHLLTQKNQSSLEVNYAHKVIPHLTSLWIAEYANDSYKHELIETTLDNFSYLFDVENERLIAAWGISKGKNTDLRDKARMAGHPLSTGPEYHRGHAIPHTLGGHTDINLVPQLGAVNIGPFRVLERLAVSTPGSLYFTYWRYSKSKDNSKIQKPVGIEQGLLIPGHPPDIMYFRN